jgi:hypothetical protein
MRPASQPPRPRPRRHTRPLRRALAGGFIAQAAQGLGLAEGVVKKDLGHVLLKLEALQDQPIQAALSAPVQVWIAEPLCD